MIFINTMLLAIIGMAYFLKAKVFLDPDFGWSIRFGELIINTGLQHRDLFSYTMPSYAFVDHEWLTHLLMAKLNALAGYDFLAIVFTAIALITVFICIRNTEKSFLSIQLLLITSCLYDFFGIRPQVISWLFFALVVLLTDKEKWKKYSFFMPAIFLLWANLHGGFTAGAIVLLVLLFFKKKLKDRILIILSLLITLVNPYGYDLWREIWISMSDPLLRLYIFEWRPIFFGISAVTLFFLSFSLAFIVRYWRKYEKQELLLFIIFLTAASSSVRNLPFFIILASIFVKRGIDSFINEVANSSAKQMRLMIFTGAFSLIVFGLTVQHFYAHYQAAKQHSEKLFFPGKAVRFLKANLPKGQIFTSYDWGGYLIWKLPQKKVFIDGRMASWKQESSLTESSNAMEESSGILLLNLDLKATFNKYGIDTVLFPNSWLTNKSDQTTLEIAKKFINELKKLGYLNIYQDETSLVFVQKKIFRH